MLIYHVSLKVPEAERAGDKITKYINNQMHFLGSQCHMFHLWELQLACCEPLAGVCAAPSDSLKSTQPKKEVLDYKKLFPTLQREH